MTAVPVCVPKASVSTARDAGSARAAAIHSLDPRSRRPVSDVVPATRTPGSWQLTDRGIVVAMAIAAMILAAAVIVIGITAVRVTSPDYDPGPQRSEPIRR
jgi:hypothetical protein